MKNRCMLHEWWVHKEVMLERRSTFTNQQIALMPPWLYNEKKNDICNNNITTPIDLPQLNENHR